MLAAFAGPSSVQRQGIEAGEDGPWHPAKGARKSQQEVGNEDLRENRTDGCDARNRQQLSRRGDRRALTEEGTKVANTQLLPVSPIVNMVSRQLRRWTRTQLT